MRRALFYGVWAAARCAVVVYALLCLVCVGLIALMLYDLLAAVTHG